MARQESGGYSALHCPAPVQRYSDWKVQQSMKYTHARVTLQFKFRSEADSRSDWEHDVLSFIQQHIMDDDTPENPIRITIEDVTK